MPRRHPALLPMLLAITAAVHAFAQKSSPPVTDASAQASPIQPTPASHPTDASAQASPGLGADPHPAAPIPSGLTLTLRLTAPLSSGTLHNGDIIPATLAVPASPSLPANTPVELTVVGAVPAGKMTAVGELSLAVATVAHRPTFTEIQTLHGNPGKSDLPDSAPALGTEATLPAGATLTFHTAGQPTPAAL